MSWFCSGYSPRRFVLGIVRFLIVDKTLAKVWKPRGEPWKWITLFNTWGSARSASEAMRAAERSIEDNAGSPPRKASSRPG